MQSCCPIEEIYHQKHSNLRSIMHPWKVAVMAVAPLSALLILIILVFWRYASLTHSQNPPPAQKERADQHARLHASSSWDNAPTKSSKLPTMWKNTSFVKAFHWANHPVLMADALERGWTAFALSSTNFPPIGASPNPWNACTKGPHQKASMPEMSWEIGPASELMQLIWFSPGVSFKHGWAPVQILHSALPIPGPAFGASSFPQEAYFEISILKKDTQHLVGLSYDYAVNEEVTLIPKSSPLVKGSTTGRDLMADLCLDGFECKGRLDSGRLSKLKNLIENGGGALVGCGQHGGKKLQLNLDAQKGNQDHIMAIGLTVEAPPPFCLPGSYLGSVGFHSDGQMFLNGTPIDKIGNDPIQKTLKATHENTLGCGFNPHTRKVFFTLNGEHMGELIGSKGEFEQPLYVSIGSNYDATVLVNFGQAPFEYIPANSHRTPAPGSQHTPSRSTKAGSFYEDSGDLFSMGMDLSQLLVESENAVSQELQTHHAFSEAESDFIEVVLEGRSLQ